MSILGDVVWDAIGEVGQHSAEESATFLAEALARHGYRIVPIEPTDAMCIELGHLERESAREAWGYALAVAPQIDVGQ